MRAEKKFLEKKMIFYRKYDTVIPYVNFQERDKGNHEKEKSRSKNRIF